MRRDLRQLRSLFERCGPPHGSGTFKAAAFCAMPAIVQGRNPTAIRVNEVTHSYQDFRYRTPYKFGGVAVDRVTLLNVQCVVSLPDGRLARGLGP